MHFKNSKNNTTFKYKTKQASLLEAIGIKFKQFCEHSSLHGFYYFYSSSSGWVYLLWFMIIALSTALCAYLGHMIWDKYTLNPTFTIVQTTQWSIEKVPFPAVSICDPELIYSPNTKNITDILNQRGYNSSDIKEFYKSFHKIKEQQYTAPEYVRKMHLTLEHLGYTYKHLINMLRKPCEVLLKHCFWRSKEFNCTAMFRDVLTPVGYCCQFEVNYFRTHADMDTVFVSGNDVLEALEVIVDTRKEVDVGTTADGLVFLYVFDSNNGVTLLDSAITLSAATYFDVKIFVWVIDSSDDVRALKLKDRQCFLDTDIDDITSSYQNCITAHIMRAVVDECRCLPFNYTSEDLHVGKLPFCTWQKLSCVYKTLGVLESDMRNVIAETNCYQRCDYEQYETETELIVWDRSTSEDKSLCRVTVHFGDNTCLKYSREVLYTWDQMLANFGGIFGLCLGGSIISIIELMWFLIELVCNIIKKTCVRKITPNNSNDFTVKSNLNAINQKRNVKNDLPFIN